MTAYPHKKPVDALFSAEKHLQNVEALRHMTVHARKCLLDSCRKAEQHTVETDPAIMLELLTTYAEANRL